MNSSEQWLKLNADYAVLWQVLMTLVGTISTYEPALIPKILTETEEFVKKIEADLPPNDPQVAAYRRSLAGLHAVFDRSHLIPSGN